MFPAEVTLMLANLLTNAVKAAGRNGVVRATAVQSDDSVKLTLENTGVRVKLAEAERWFRPFESTTVAVDPVLGQGMGMGLPITRNMLEEYGAKIEFVEPSAEFETAVQITFAAE
jgi:signal transduction histidine kinase